MKKPSNKTLKLKALSVNECWQGRRFKTPKYKAYEEEVNFLLDSWKPELSEKMEITLTVGFSNRASDIDNVAKPLLDILQKKYGFNDKQVYKLTLNKEIVKKGSEFIEIITN